jgi:hypothetical protein
MTFIFPQFGKQFPVQWLTKANQKHHELYILTVCQAISCSVANKSKSKTS